MHIGILIVYDQLAVFTVPAGLFFGDLDSVVPTCTLAEDGVHFLERAVGRFRIVEVDHWDDEGIAAVNI